jgi:uncharacterized membrane-anchored protein YhcB (DUF1043 family)
LPERKKEAFVVVTDNAANMLNAVKRLEYTHLWYVSNSFYYDLSEAQKGFYSCEAHTLQLVIKDSLSEMRLLLDKCKSIVTHFSRSAKLTQQLKEEQKLHNVERPLKLIHDIDTRWNSTYYMLLRLCKLRADVQRVLHQNKEAQNCLSENNEWFQLEELIRLLAEFEEATSIISGENYPSLSLFVAAIKAFDTVLVHYSSTDTTIMKVDTT